MGGTCVVHGASMPPQCDPKATFKPGNRAGPVRPACGCKHQFLVTSSRVTAQYWAETGRERIMILRTMIGVVVGGGLGYAYYRLVGCSTGTCPLTSNPFITIIYGGVVGALVASSLH